MLADLLASLPCPLCEVQNADILPVQMVPGGAQPVEANDGKLQEETPGFRLESDYDSNKLRLSAPQLSAHSS